MVNKQSNKLELIKEIYQVLSSNASGRSKALPSEEVYTSRMMRNDEQYVNDLHDYYVKGVRHSGK